MNAPANSGARVGLSSRSRTNIKSPRRVLARYATALSVDVQRRRFITGIAGILVSATAPAIITTPGLLMPVRKIIVPDEEQLVFFSQNIVIDQMRGYTKFGELSQVQKEFWSRSLWRAAGGYAK